MAGEIRRGAAAIQAAVDANENRGGGSFKPFLPGLFWKDDKESRYLLFLNTIEEVPQFDAVSFIPTENGFFETVVAKTDQYFGEKSDRFEKVWDATVRVTDFAVAVELEPILELVKGKKRPKGFEVATKTFDRKIFDDDGDDTGETEEVTTPVIGVISQSPYNFFNVVKSYDAEEAPIHETPVKITRLGKDQNTSYTITGYVDQEIDLSNLIEFIDGISYLGKPEDIEAIVEQIADLEPLEAANAIGTILLDKRVEELLDEDRYEELFEGVDESMDKFGNKKKKGKKDEKKPERKTRPSQRRKAAEPEDEWVDEGDSGDAPDEPEPEKPKRTRRTTRAKATPADDGDDGSDEPEVTSESPAKAKLAALRERAAAQKAAKED